jgi:hypothetical protein
MKNETLLTDSYDVNYILDQSISMKEKEKNIDKFSLKALNALMDDPTLSMDGLEEIAKKINQLSIQNFIKLYNTIEERSKDNPDYQYLHIYLYVENMKYKKKKGLKVIETCKRLGSNKHKPFNPYNWSDKRRYENMLKCKLFFEYLKKNYT